MTDTEREVSIRSCTQLHTTTLTTMCFWYTQLGAKSKEEGLDRKVETQSSYFYFPRLWNSRWFLSTITIIILIIIMIFVELSVVAFGVAKAGKLFSRWAHCPSSPLPSVAHLFFSMLMPCNDLRHTGIKERERNLLSAQLCCALCFCCYSNTGMEVKLTRRCLFAWQDGVIFFFKWQERVGVQTSAEK